MLPIIYEEICNKHQFIDEEDMDKIIVLSQSLPGVMAVNCATQVGYRLFRLPGAFCATLGAVLPSFLIITFLASFIMVYRTTPLMANVLFAIRSVVVGLILAAAVKMGRKCFRSPFQMLLMAIAVVLMVLQWCNPALIVLAAAFAGYVYSRVRMGV